MRILVTGSRGFIGSALCEVLRRAGHEVLQAYHVRQDPRTSLNGVGSNQGLLWNSAGGFADTAALEGLNAVVHLAGEDISGTWTSEKMSAIRHSRVDGTRTIAETLASLTHKPEVLLFASGVGYYGSQGDEPLDEDHRGGEGFLATVSRDTERAAEAARNSGIRTVAARFGIVLSEHGGALARMLPVFRTGLGGRLGTGRQYWSWITLDDAVAALVFAMGHRSIRGPVNIVTSNPVTNEEFTQTLGRVLGRPTLLAVPTVILRLMTGRIAEEILLASMRVLPRKLVECGFIFQFPDLERALRHLLEAARPLPAKT